MDTLPKSLHDYSKTNCGISTYHAALERITGREVKVSTILDYYRRGFTAGYCAHKLNNDASLSELEQLLMEAWEIIIDRGESTDYPLQTRQHAWLNKMNKRYQD